MIVDWKEELMRHNALGKVINKHIYICFEIFDIGRSPVDLVVPIPQNALQSIVRKIK